MKLGGREGFGAMVAIETAMRYFLRFQAHRFTGAQVVRLLDSWRSALIDPEARIQFERDQNEAANEAAAKRAREKGA